jgi:hypothetical protein
MIVPGGGISLVAHGRSHGRPPRRPVFWIQWHGGVLLTQMLSVCMLVHLLPVQLKYGFMKVADTLTVCLPGVRPSMITQYPAVPVGNSSAPTGRPGGPVKNTWPSLPCATTPAENSVMIDSCRLTQIMHDDNNFAATVA